MAINNPYIPGDPYSYDLKWIVAKIKEHSTILSTLDEMITEKIKQLLDEHDPIYFNTAADLISSDMKAPSLAYIEGFYGPGDGGANLYYITSDYNDVLAADFYLTLDGANRWAIPVIVTPYVTPEMFGAKGDGTEDDTTAVNTALSVGSLVIFSKDYAVTTDWAGDRCVQIPSGRRLDFIEGACIRGINENMDVTNVLLVNGSNDVVINDAHIIGDAADNTSPNEGNGHCLRIINSDNIQVNGGTYSYAHTDSIYISDCHNVSVKDVVCDHSGRLGITVISGEKISIENAEVFEISRVAPSCGIGMEPNLATQILKDISIKNCYIHDVASNGIYGFFNVMNGSEEISIDIDDIVVDTAASCMTFTADNASLTGSLNIRNVVAKNLGNGVYTFANVSTNSLIISLTNSRDYSCNLTQQGATFGNIVNSSGTMTNAGNLVLDNVYSFSPDVIKDIGVYAANGFIAVTNCGFETLTHYYLHPEYYLDECPMSTRTTAGQFYLLHKKLVGSGAFTLRPSFAEGVEFSARSTDSVLTLTVLGTTQIIRDPSGTIHDGIFIDPAGYADIIFVDGKLTVKSGYNIRYYN